MPVGHSEPWSISALGYLPPERKAWLLGGHQHRGWSRLHGGGAAFVRLGILFLQDHRSHSHQTQRDVLVFLNRKVGLRQAELSWLEKEDTNPKFSVLAMNLIFKTHRAM